MPADKQKLYKAAEGTLSRRNENGGNLAKINGQ